MGRDRVVRSEPLRAAVWLQLLKAPRAGHWGAQREARGPAQDAGPSALAPGSRTPSLQNGTKCVPTAHKLPKAWHFVMALQKDGNN